MSQNLLRYFTIGGERSRCTGTETPCYTF